MLGTSIQGIRRMSELFALVVDDDPALGTLFATILRDAGITTETLTDGTQTLTKMADRIPDLVTLDLQMPRTSGVDILREIRADARFANTRVMVITASSQTSYNPDIQEMADLVLLKPVTFEQVSNFAGRLLQMARKGKGTNPLANAPEVTPQVQSKP
jgi:DNA-binding response OmpR family regulator